MQASGTFEVELRPQKHDTVETGRIIMQKRYIGGMQGAAEGQMLSYRTNVEGSAGYVALEHFTGTINGLQGSVRFTHCGLMNRGTQSLTVSIIPDSGTAGLRNISGVMHIQVEDGSHQYTLDYQLNDTA